MTRSDNDKCLIYNYLEMFVEVNCSGCVVVRIKDCFGCKLFPPRGSLSLLEVVISGLCYMNVEMVVKVRSSQRLAND